MKHSFEIVSPDYIAADSKAIEYLERGAAGFGGMVSVKKTIREFKLGRDIFVLVKNETILRGAIHLNITQQETGRVLTSILLGGDDFGEWADELRKFYYKLAHDNECHEFSLMGRRGFKRYFPELQEIATVFRVRLT